MVLFDANVLIALGDSEHIHRSLARTVLEASISEGWATCPLTENAFLRILGHPNYPKGPGSANRARSLLKQLTALPGHQFWSDDFSIVDIKAFPQLPVSGGLTDFYLLALAVKHGGRLATFDRRIDPALLAGGPSAYQIISS